MNLTINNELLKELNKKVGSSSVESYIENLIKKDLEENHRLNYGYYFNLNNSRLYNNDNKEIKLTSKPLMILKCLIENKGNTVSIGTISKYVWSKEDVSVFTIRNMVKRIRDKSYSDIILSVKGLGYKLKQ